MKQNVTLQDIKEVSKEMNIHLTNEVLNNILNEYNREVMDKGESWDELVRILIIKEGTIQFLKGLNK